LKAVRNSMPWLGLFCRRLLQVLGLAIDTQLLKDLQVSGAAASKMPTIESGVVS